MRFSRFFLKIFYSFIMTFLLSACIDFSEIESNDNSENLPPGIISTPPNISVIGEASITLIRGGVYIEGGAIAVDDQDGNLLVTISGSVNTENIGIYIITYMAKDSDNNVSIETRVVSVVLGNESITDTLPPEITLLDSASLILFKDEEYFELGATATDNIDGNLNVTINGSVDSSKLGVYVITYLATDSAGNSTVIARAISVVELPADTENPIITLNGPPEITLIQGDVYEDAGATALDKRDGELVVIVTGYVNTSLEGVYFISYSASDNSHNVSTVTRTITVVPSPLISPVVDAGEDRTTTSSSEVTLNAFASDVDGNIISYTWSQTSGINVNISNEDSAGAVFTAPDLNIGDEPTVLTFSVSVSDNDGNTNNDSVTITITPARINIVISPSRISCIAPCGVVFDATKTTASDFHEPFHQLDYRWSYGDINSNFIERPDLDANSSSAPIGAHVFATQGSYQVRLIVTDMNGETASRITTIEVQDPEQAYSELTYCISISGSFANCPTQDTNFHLTTFSSAAQLMIGLRWDQNFRPSRFLFRAGEIFQGNSSPTIRGLTADLHISSYDNGAMPIIDIGDHVLNGGLLSFNDNNGVTISGIEFRGNYDPSTGIGSHPSPLFFYLASKNTTIYRNRFSGLGLNVYMHGGANGDSVSEFQMVVDNNITKWQNMGIFGDFGYLGAVVANTIKQSINAVSGDDDKCGSCVPNLPDHGPIRVGSPNHLLIQYNKMFNNAGWSSSGLAHQPNIRAGTNGASIKLIISENFLEGGFTALSMRPSNTELVGGNADAIIEKNQMQASSNTMTLIDMGLGGVTIRNNLFLKPNNGAPEIGTSSFKTAISFRAENPDNIEDGTLGLVNQIYNNTLISNAVSSAPSLTLLDVESSFISFKVHNNLLHMPLVDEDAGLFSWNHDGDFTNLISDNNLVYAPLIDNYVYNKELSYSLSQWQEGGNDLLSKLNDPSLFDSNNFDARLTPSSPAVDTGVLVEGLFIDIDGKVRDQPIDIGAYELE